jgi:hypothetical protein
MPTRWGVALAAAATLTAGGATPALAAEPVATAHAWSADLAAGETAGVVIADGAVTLRAAGTHLAAAEGSDGPSEPTGLLTLPARRLDVRTDRVEAALDGDIPSGGAATVDVRGRRSTGVWTEWLPSGESASVVLPEPTTEVQARLVLTGRPGAAPVVRGLTLTAHPAGRERLARQESAIISTRVFATREGLVGGTTANGHVITERDLFVALPSRRALAPRNTADYSVRVCTQDRCAFAPVWDVGPWNTRDDYWNPPDVREEWALLPQGLPQAQAAFEQGFNDGLDQFGRRVKNPAGIDLADGIFWDALALKDNEWVTVDYLWTGPLPLANIVAADGPVEVRAAPDTAADVVGLAAEKAGVPVECVLDSGQERWLKLGEGQFVPASAVPPLEVITACAQSEPPATG